MLSDSKPILNDGHLTRLGANKLQIPGHLRLRCCAALASTAILSSLAACGRTSVPEAEAQPAPAEPQHPTPPVTHLSAKHTRPTPERLVAIGDLHGDLDHARRALRLAGAIDDHDRWIGGHLVVVQTGDEIDRGDDDRRVLDLTDALKTQAATAGGEVLALLGNHEIMNAALDFRYVTTGGLAAFSLFGSTGAATVPGQLPPEAKGRAAAFAPGGSYATLLASRPFFAKVGDTLFVHGGILPKHVAYGLERMDDELDAWLSGRRASAPAALVAEDGPVWTRAYSSEEGAPNCAELATVLSRLGAKRMVVGHTVQHRGVNGACEGHLWRIDVGLSHYFGGPIQVLEIRGDDIAVLREASPP
jgi:hypothetical protein